MSDKKVKLAVIRSNDSDGCPFGLEVPYACSSVGELIFKMAPTSVLGDDSSEEEQTEIAIANNYLFLWKNPESRCPFAGKLFKESEVVECNYGSNAPGVKERGTLLGSPFFAKHFSGIGLDGLYSIPLGYYSENAIDKGMYYGYSIESMSGYKANLQKISTDKPTESSEDEYIDEVETDIELIEGAKQTKENSNNTSQFNPKYQKDLLSMLHFPSKYPFESDFANEDEKELLPNTERITLDLLKATAGGKKMICGVEGTEFFIPEIFEMGKEELDNIKDFNDYIDQSYLDKLLDWTKSIGLEHIRTNGLFKGRPFPLFFWYKSQNANLMDLITDHIKNKSNIKPDIYHLINGIIYGFSMPSIVHHVMNDLPPAMRPSSEKELVMDMKDYFGEAFASQLIREMGIQAKA